MADFTDHDVLVYLDLVQRRTHILLHSGIDWKPEYGPELAAIDQQLSAYRLRIELCSKEVV